MLPSFPLDLTSALSTLLETRHSCRAFRPDRVPRAMIEEVFAIAQRTASWSNVQPWQVTLVSGQTLERLRRSLTTVFDAGSPPERDIPFPSRFTGSHLERRRACGYSLYEAVKIDREDHDGRQRQSRRNCEFFGAPHVAFLSTSADLGPYALVDVGGYLPVLMLAMQSRGIASIAQAALANQSGLIREQLSIPADQLLVCGVSFGLEDTSDPVNAFRTKRANADEVMRFLDV